MSIQVEEGDETRTIKTSPRPAPVAPPVEEAVKAPIGEPGPAPLNFRTEVCTLEILFADYINSLIPAAESFSPSEQVTSGDIDQAVFLLRLLRETVIAQLSECMRVFPDNDPFFPQPVMPQMLVVRDKDFKALTSIPLSTYLHRLSLLHPNFAYDGILANITEDFFRVGVKSGHDGQHFLILPDERELLRAIGTNGLFTAASY